MMEQGFMLVSAQRACPGGQLLAPVSRWMPLPHIILPCTDFLSTAATP